MKKTVFLWAIMAGCLGLQAQNYQLNLHKSGSVVYQNDVNAIEEIRFEGNLPANMLINDGNGSTFPITAFDSITFSRPQTPPSGDTVYITYNGSSVDVTNPFSDDGVYINVNGAEVDVQSYRENVPYVVSGQSDNGRLVYYSTAPFNLILNNLSLSNTSTAAIGQGVIVPVTLTLKGTSTLADGANGSQKGALDLVGDLAINGSGRRKSLATRSTGYQPTET